MHTDLYVAFFTEKIYLGDLSILAQEVVYHFLFIADDSFLYGYTLDLYNQSLVCKHVSCSQSLFMNILIVSNILQL